MRTFDEQREALRTIIATYRSGEESLNALATQSEGILSAMGVHLGEALLQRAMNCAYIIEEINAVVLDENRSPNVSERLQIENEIERLLALI